MKTKKNKLAKFLKIGILLFGVSLFLWNCEKENITETIEPKSKIEKIQGLFNKEQFKKVIPYEFQVNWKDNGIQYSQELKSSYYEFDIFYTSQLTPNVNDAKKKKGNYYKSFKIIATVNNDEIINFYALRVYEKITETGIPISKVNFKTSSNFNGLIHLVNANNEIVYAKKLKKETHIVKEFFDKEFKELNPLKSKMIETCVTVTTHHYKDWYKKWTDDEGTHIEYTSTQYLGSSQEVICGYEWLPDYEGGGGGSGSGSPNGSGTYKNNCSSTNSKTKYFSKVDKDCATKVVEEEIECEKGFELNELGKCVKKDDQIFNLLTGKDKCIYDKLKKLSLFKQTIGKFSKGSYDLTFKYGSKCNGGEGEEACTDASDLHNGNISIKILGSGTQSLDFAATLLHEGIHAEIYKYVDEHKKGIDPNNRKSVFHYYNYYSAKNNDRFETSIAQHQHMQDVFVIPIAKAIRQLDNYRLPLENYYGFAWEGLKEDYDYDKYIDINGKVQVMTPEKYSNYINKMYNVISTTKFKDILKNCN